MLVVVQIIRHIFIWRFSNQLSTQHRITPITCKVNFPLVQIGGFGLSARSIHTQFLTWKFIKASGVAKRCQDYGGA